MFTHVVFIEVWQEVACKVWIRPCLLRCDRLGGKRRAGVLGYGAGGPRVRGPGAWKTWGVENTGSGGKHGVSVENTGSKCKTQRNHYFAQQWSLNFVISNCNENQSAWNAFFGHKSELNISWERKPFKCQLDMQWFSFAWGVCFIFRRLA